MARSTVAILKTSPATVLRDYHALMNLAGYQDVLAKDVDTALKVNISWHFFFPGSSTTPWQLDGVTRALLADGYARDRIHACHNRTVVIDAHLGERENKQLNVVEAHGLRNIHLYEGDEPWIHIRDAVGDLTQKFLCLNEVYPDGFMIPRRFIGENIIHLPTVKTHVFTTTTGAMKNAFGGLLNERRHWTHPVIHETLVDLLMIQKKIHRGVFAVMDGTFAGDGPGPRCMVPHVKNVILASADQVAIDAVAARLMGFDPLSIKFIRLAHDAGLGVRRPARHRDRGRHVGGRRVVAASSGPFKQDDVRGADAAPHLLGPAAQADRVVAQDGAGAMGLSRQRALSRQFLVSVRRGAPDEGRPGQSLGTAVRELGTPDARRGRVSAGGRRARRGHADGAGARSSSRSASSGRASWKHPNLPAAGGTSCRARRREEFHGRFQHPIRVGGRRADHEADPRTHRREARSGLHRGADPRARQRAAREVPGPARISAPTCSNSSGAAGPPSASTRRRSKRPTRSTIRRCSRRTAAPLRFIRRLLMPILKLFFNPNTLNQILYTQSQFNVDMLKRDATRRIERAEWNALYYEVLHNLVLETTRMSIEVKNLRMRVESLSSRLDFSERRVRALEGVVQYRPEAMRPRERRETLPEAAAGAATEGVVAERRTPP